MKQTIRVKLIEGDRIIINGTLPKMSSKGDWIDLYTRESVSMHPPVKTVRGQGKVSSVQFDYKLIPLGLAMELPPGYEAIIAPRSSTFKHYGITMANSIGIVDNSYKGDNDEWMFPAIAFKDTVIAENDRICQFRIQLSQKATMWQKIKWLFTDKIEFLQVESLGNKDRNGIGSTGK